MSDSEQVASQITVEEEEPSLDDYSEVVFYKSPLAVLPSLLCFMLLVGASIWLSLKFPLTIQYISIIDSDTWLGPLPIPLLGLAPLVYGTYIFHTLYDQRYVIGHSYVRCVCGLLSLSKHDYRVDFQDIRGVEIDRSLYGRLVNIGDLSIGSASHADLEIMLVGIFNPSYYRDIIAQRRQKYNIEILRESHEVHPTDSEDESGSTRSDGDTSQISQEEK